jgi:pyrroloquinoline quinone biosynthesis protein B
MYIKLLGSAAGGGVPQWNCDCRQCHAARLGLIETRTQCSVAISADRRRWILVNASPDLRSQITKLLPHTPEPQSFEHRRNNPIHAVLLTDADLDHTLGLFLLRESDVPIVIHGSVGIMTALKQGLQIADVLNQYCGVQWTDTADAFVPILYRDAQHSGLECKAIEIEGPGPKYYRNGSCRVFYVIRDRNTQKSLLVAPAVAKFEHRLLTEMGQADAILIDGTFWAADDFEKSGVQSSSLDELLQSHLPISKGGYEALADMRARHKVYIHLNNTNPILWNNSPERWQLEKLGIQVGFDGMELEL